MAASASTAVMTELLGTVPDCAWENVASFAAPSDCYNIALASKRFFRPVSSSPPAPSQGGQKPRRKSKRLKSAGGSPPLLLATRMLRVSLEHNLERVLEHSRSGITLESLKKLGELPEGSAVIAGSTMVQACLGVLWGEGGEKTYRDGKSDVDIFCSAKAAPAVRSRQDVVTVDTNIHHVEHWGSISENVVRKDYYGYGKKAEPESLPPDGNAKNTAYYKKVIGYGKQCQRTYIDWKVENVFHSSDLGRLALHSFLLSCIASNLTIYFLNLPTKGIDQNKAYDVKPKSGGDLPFDFHGDGNIDLVVGRLKDKSGDKKIAPSDLLSDFDLEICKCSFDGKKFHIADPHNTFSGKTQMEPKRRAVVSSYANHFSPPTNNKYMDGDVAAFHTSAVIRKVRVDIPSSPFYGRLDFAASLPNRYNPQDLLHDRITRVKYGASIQFHNFVKKLIDRLKKYQSRGIEVLDAPAIAHDMNLRRYDLIGLTSSEIDRTPPPSERDGEDGVEFARHQKSRTLERTVDELIDGYLFERTDEGGHGPTHWTSQGAEGTQPSRIEPTPLTPRTPPAGLRLYQLVHIKSPTKEKQETLFWATHCSPHKVVHLQLFPEAPVEQNHGKKVNPLVETSFCQQALDDTTGCDQQGSQNRLDEAICTFEVWERVFPELDKCKKVADHPKSERTNRVPTERHGVVLKQREANLWVLIAKIANQESKNGPNFEVCKKIVTEHSESECDEPNVLHDKDELIRNDAQPLVVKVGDLEVGIVQRILERRKGTTT
ncbi:hypothetical protein THAOC_16396 [Thalassiosira oceanica]|uniref:Uncharacterized protein n=1 Tax=Thalassiosira oceanica TaxID=159749 RepID=K0S9X4_THAOC|nr:hypothetical protein THAOC_16396 [Thalassiosira oceanica]|eukprot:EJK62973.1 hypothetical protein THAOC_16396 [Thalassiosira oceanica]